MTHRDNAPPDDNASPDPAHDGDDRLTAAQLDAVAAGGLFGTEYWILGTVSGSVDVYDGNDNLVATFASTTDAHMWILTGGTVPTLDG